nr:MAG TPA: hypothetical protein [Caudoviricetes sp.]
MLKGSQEPLPCPSHQKDSCLLAYLQYHFLLVR